MVNSAEGRRCKNASQHHLLHGVGLGLGMVDGFRDACFLFCVVTETMKQFCNGSDSFLSVFFNNQHVDSCFDFLQESAHS